MTRVLGLDLGPNSVGWAIIDRKEDGTASFVDMGVRIFPEGVDNFDTAKEVSRTEARRIARGMRRQIKRRKRRLATLRRALAECGLLPTNTNSQNECCKLDPYDLRHRALSERLEPFQLGRIFLHLAKRRGFLSNRKKDRKDSEVKGMLAEINALEAERQEKQAPTLGSLLHHKQQEFSHRRRQDNDQLRNRHTARAMYEAEFDAIWEVQYRLGHEQLTEQLRYGHAGKGKYPCIPRRRAHGKSPLEAYGIYGLIFFQRKMYWPRSRVGMCALEPRQRRCAIADRSAQRFRLLQEVNNLRFVDPSKNSEEALSPAHRDALVKALSSAESLTFDQIRKVLGFPDTLRFNLERGKRPKLQGNETDALVAKALGKRWHLQPEEAKDRLVRAILNPDLDELEFVQYAEQSLGLSQSDAEKALNIDLRQGYSHLSLKAIDRLLPFLEKGLVYQAESDPEKSALHAAGYLRRDELQRRLFDSLPNPDRLKNSPLGDIPNPVVKRAFSELRKVLNGILREYRGEHRIQEIHVEMGRDVKTRPKRGTKAFDKYMDRLDEMRQREAERDLAATKLRESDIRPSRENVLKYLLWQQQQGECVYSGNSISFAQLFGQDIEIDHILPWSRCLDDSQMNKVVCFRHTTNKLGNHEKRNQTPYEWLGGKREAEFEAMCQRAKRLPYPKYRRFLLKELKLDDFIQRQLNDTRYLAKLAVEYLKCLVAHDHDVLGLKGQLTSELRHIWGLDTVLAELPDSPAWHEQAKLSQGEKNRADHRHHAIDALVVALTDRRRLNDLSKLFRGWAAHERDPDFSDPWPEFRKSIVQSASRIKVSRRCERKVAGGLHEDTIYGKTNNPGEWVVRKPLDSLSANEIERIRDESIRKIVIARLKQYGIEFGRKTKPDAKKWKEALHDVYMPSGVPIKKVRVLRPELTIQPIRMGSANECYVKPGSTHHICIFEINGGKKPKREAVFVTMLEAANRIKTGNTIVQRQHPSKPEAQFVMSLSRGEYVLIEADGNERLLYFRTAASTQGQLYFAEHTDARKGDEARKFVFTANTLKARKVTVDPLGRIRWAND
jgi:CRISPR-associated endonuclease Csn1